MASLKTMGWRKVIVFLDILYLSLPSLVSHEEFNELSHETLSIS